MSGNSGKWPGHNGIEDPFLRQLWDILRAHPTGISEYELFNALADQGKAEYDRSAWQSEHALFCRHFLLFNALYRLREQLHMQQCAQIEISALKICLSEWQACERGLPVGGDPLREFYLDITQLEKMSADDVKNMLGDFWSGFYSNESRREALSVLGLEDPVSNTDIKQHYRRLAMQHHPDRGGDDEQLSRINAAMNILSRG